MNKRLEERLKIDPILREYYPKLLAIPLKPKTEVHIQLEGKIAEAARANPASVRVSARGADDTHVVGRGNVQLVEVK
jgi:hypothetical protein